MAFSIRPRSSSLSDVAGFKNISLLPHSKSESDLQALEKTAEASRLESLNSSENNQPSPTCCQKIKKNLCFFKELVVFFFQWLWGKILKIFCCKKEPPRKDLSQIKIEIDLGEEEEPNEQPLPVPDGSGLGNPPLPPSSSSSSSSGSSSSLSFSVDYIQRHPHFLALPEKEVHLLKKLLTTLADVKLEVVRFTVTEAKKNITINPLKYIGYCIQYFNNELNVIASMKAHPKRWPNFVKDFGERMLQYRTVQQLLVITQFCEHFNLEENLVVRNIGECERAPNQHEAWSGFIKKLQEAIADKQGEFYQAPSVQLPPQQPPTVASELSIQASSASMQSSSSSSSSSIAIPIQRTPLKINPLSTFLKVLTQEQEGNLIQAMNTMGYSDSYVDLFELKKKENRLKAIHPLYSIGYNIQHFNINLVAIKYYEGKLPWPVGLTRWDKFVTEWKDNMRKVLEQPDFSQTLNAFSEHFRFSPNERKEFMSKLDACKASSEDTDVLIWGDLIKFLQSKIHPGFSNLLDIFFQNLNSLPKNLEKLRSEKFKAFRGKLENYMKATNEKERVTAWNDLIKFLQQKIP